MNENKQSSVASLIHQLYGIEKLIENKEYISALAQIREVQGAEKVDSYSIEVGQFYYLSTKVFYHLGSYQEALEVGQKALSIFVHLHGELKIAQTQFLLGLIYISMGNLKAAEIEIRDALTGHRRTDDLKGVIRLPEQAF
jgi:tetratricopeptide (TPR) repeat protein